MTVSTCASFGPVDLNSVIKQLSVSTRTSMQIELLPISALETKNVLQHAVLKGYHGPLQMRS